MRPQVGEVFQERYLILAQLGAGGMGSVYHAKQLDAGRDVALKLLHDDAFASSEIEARFYREFKILSLLNHPNIMTMYGLALDDDNVPFAVCEYLDGVSLRQLLLQSRLPWLRAAKITIQICHAVQYAHDQGILHRDLKPENVVIMQRPEPDFVKLIDFGLSRALESLQDSHQKITNTGLIVGSPQYMSPEQITGHAASHSDIYSLGCLLFELLSGSPLFEAETPSAIIFKHMNENPSHRIRALSSDSDPVPPRLISILHKMVEKKTERRFQSMAEVAAELERVIENPLSKTAPDAQYNESRRWVKPVAFSIAGIVLLGGAVLSWNLSLSKQHPAQIVTSIRHHRVAKLGSKSVSREQAVFESLRLRQAGKAKQAVEVMKKAIANGPADDPDPYWNYDANIELSDAYMDAGDFVSAEKALYTAIDLFQYRGAPKRIYAGCHLANAYDRSGDAKKAEQTFLRFIYDCEESGNIANATILNAYDDYGAFLAAHNRFEEAYKVMQKALLYANHCAHGTYADTAHDRGTCEAVTCTWQFYDFGDHLHRTAEARRELDKTSADLHSTPVRDAYTVHAIQLYANHACDHGFDQEAIEMYQLLLKDCKNLAGPDAKGYEDACVPQLAALLKKTHQQSN